MTVLIPDVSEFQSGSSTPDWAGIKAANGGAGIIRVGYGYSHLDAMFVQNYTAMKTRKFVFLGLYHYLVAGQDATAQAEQFCSWVGPMSAVYPGTVFICDLEEGGGDQSGRAAAWLSAVDSFYRLDRQPLNRGSWLYSYVNFVAGHGLDAIFASPRRTWIASYSNAEPAIGHSLWQCTDGSFGSHITDWPGCGRTDTSIFNGSLMQLASIGWNPPAPGPVPFHGEYVTGGMFSLPGIALKLGVSTDALLSMTAIHYGSLGPLLGGWLDAVLSGAWPLSTPVPAGVKVWVD